MSKVRRLDPRAREIAYEWFRKQPVVSLWELARKGDGGGGC